MRFTIAMFGLGLILIPVFAAAAGEQRQVPLEVPAGIPLRLYLSQRLHKKMGAPVEAKVLEPVYAFDRQVIPAGSVVRGQVTLVKPVSKGVRVRAMLNGDFTPLHTAGVTFTTLVLPDGQEIPLRTAENFGLNSIVSDRPAKKQGAASGQNTGVLGTGKQKAEDAIHAQIDRAKSIPQMIRMPDKKEKAEDYLMAKLPYHPQYLRKGTRFDAELLEPLGFGSEPVTAALAQTGTQPPPDSVAHARLVTPLDSASAKPGENVEAVLAEPVFGADHKLVLPEGTRLEGTVVAARRARWFHRSGQLRFNFKEMQLPDDVAQLLEATRAAASVPVAPRSAQESLKVRTEANLQAAESQGKTPLKVDREGGVQARKSKTRFLGAAVAAMVARSAGDNDPIRNQAHQVVGQSQNVGGRTIGGGFGFGLLGVGISQSSRWVGTAFGYYGMAWSLFSTLIARGSEVQFGKDAMIDIRFDTRAEKARATGKSTAR